jgi:hypothetical protein
MTNNANAATAPANNMEVKMTSFFPAVDMGTAGIVTIEVLAADYATAYRGAVEQLLLEPEATLKHAMLARLHGEM